jgi:hypothetical protein
MDSGSPGNPRAVPAQVVTRLSAIDFGRGSEAVNAPDVQVQVRGTVGKPV